MEVPVSQQGRGFYLPLFLVKEKTRDLCSVLDLKGLNKKTNVESFKVESLQSILLAINLKD